MTKPSPQLPSMTGLLAYGGLIPFMTLTLLLVFGVQFSFLSQETQLRLLHAYGVIIVTFVGAMHWGIALSKVELPESHANLMLVYSVAPSLMAWSSYLVSESTSFVILSITYLLAYTVDKRLLAPHVAAEFMDMRRNLSFLVAGVMLYASQAQVYPLP